MNSSCSRPASPQQQRGRGRRCWVWGHTAVPCTPKGQISAVFGTFQPPGSLEGVQFVLVFFSYHNALDTAHHEGYAIQQVIVSAKPAVNQARAPRAAPLRLGLHVVAGSLNRKFPKFFLRVCAFACACLQG